MQPGATYLGNKEAEFVLWAPKPEHVELVLHDDRSRSVPLERFPNGYWRKRVINILPGSRYSYRLNGEKEFPDPASHFQPDGVHQSSTVVDHRSFHWTDSAWKNVPLEHYVMYELHIGTFTPEGTFESIIPRLRQLRELGITAIEIMPVAQFPGTRNWGYDGVLPYAVQNSYGGPDGLKKLVDSAHREELAVILDVVYNHFGPEGNYLSQFGPYFTDRYKTPWGPAINYDDAWSDEVRKYFIGNALYWSEKYHIDALRLDAVHAIYDFSATPFLKELKLAVEEFSRKQGREFYLIAESDLSDRRIIASRDEGGYALDAQWLDDYHHALRGLLTGERGGYYEDYGNVEHLVKAISKGYVYDGGHSSFRKRRHGNSSADLPGKQFVVFCQNHDQVGNRMLGERLAQLTTFEGLKLAAACYLLSPCLPMLFMGEEYGEENPFLYFVSHSDQGLIEAVRKGRKEEFQSFQWQGEPPDPQSEETFNRSKLSWERRTHGKHAILLEFYGQLISCRRSLPALASLDKHSLDVCGDEKNKTIILSRWTNDSEVLVVMNFHHQQSSVVAIPPGRYPGQWKQVLNSSDRKWNGPGSSTLIIEEKRRELSSPPLSFLLYRKE